MESENDWDCTVPPRLSFLQQDTCVKAIIANYRKQTQKRALNTTKEFSFTDLLNKGKGLNYAIEGAAKANRSIVKLGAADEHWEEAIDSFMSLKDNSDVKLIDSVSSSVLNSQNSTRSKLAIQRADDQPVNLMDLLVKDL